MMGIMRKVFAEVDLEGNIRLLGKEGGSYSSLSDFERKSDLVAALTSSKVIDRVYSFPKLKKEQLDVALKQRLIKDLEYIANVEDLDYVYSSFQEGNSLKVLVSLVPREEVPKFLDLKALTFSSQVIACFLFKKGVAGDFLLVHDFKEDFVVLAFKNGIVDYVRTFVSSESVDGAIELSLEYYKEQKKTEIKDIYFSGTKNLNTGYEVKSIKELLEINDLDEEFFVPYALSKVSVPFLFRKKFWKPEYSVLLASAVLFGFTGFLSYFNGLMANEVRNLKSRELRFRSEIGKFQKELSKEKRIVRELETLVNSPRNRYIASLSRPLVQEFLYSLYSLTKFNTYVLRFDSDGFGRVRLELVTFNTKKPVNVKDLLRVLQNNPYVETAKTLNVKKDKGFYTTLFSLKLKRKRYE